MGGGNKAAPLLKKDVNFILTFNASHGGNPISGGEMDPGASPRCLPVDFPSIERLRVEYHGGRVPGLGTVDADFSSKLHPGDGEDGAGIGTRQGEHVLLPVLQEPQHTSREKGGVGQAHRRERGSWGSGGTGETNQLPAKGTGLPPSAKAGCSFTGICLVRPTVSQAPRIQQ